MMHNNSILVLDVQVGLVERSAMETHVYLQISGGES